MNDATNTAETTFLGGRSFERGDSTQLEIIKAIEARDRAAKAGDRVSAAFIQVTELGTSALDVCDAWGLDGRQRGDLADRLVAWSRRPVARRPAKAKVASCKFRAVAS